MPASTAPGTSVTLASFTTVRNAIGNVAYCAIHEPHCEPPHCPIQSKQSGSCSAPIVMVPPYGTGSFVVTTDAPEVPAFPLGVALPHAAMITESAPNSATARRKRRAIRPSRHLPGRMKAFLRQPRRTQGSVETQGKQHRREGEHERDHDR